MLEFVAMCGNCAMHRLLPDYFGQSPPDHNLNLKTARPISNDILL
jgi:hypothetical protein